MEEKKEEKKSDGAASEGGSVGGEGKEEKAKEEKKEGGSDEGAKGEAPASGGEGGEETKLVDLRKNEYYYYHPHQNYQLQPARYTAEAAYGYPPAPQMFSDENPNACVVM